MVEWFTLHTIKYGETIAQSSLYRYLEITMRILINGACLSGGDLRTSSNIILFNNIVQ